MTRRRKYRNRLIYLCALAFFFATAWAYGGAMLYLSLYTLLLLPVFSLLITFAALFGLKVTQRSEQTRLIKDEPGRYAVVLHNRTPLLFGDIQCRFIDDHFAVETNREIQSFFARPFAKETHTIDFRVRYRGSYRLGLYALHVNDTLGLFTLKKRLKETITLTVWPKLTDISYFPLAQNILSQSNSNFEIREEDYAVVSDVRRYEPTDPLKRVHWKLTAKKNEWMVKNFQTNALNRVTVIMDTFKPSDIYEDAVALEDKMVEAAVSVMHFCLRHNMPVECHVRTDVRREAYNQDHFNELFGMMAELSFDGTKETSSVLPILGKCINETSGYINAVLLVTELDTVLFHKLINAGRMGHTFSVLYFVIPGKEIKHNEEYYKRLTESGVTCFTVTPETDLEGDGLE